LAGAGVKLVRARGDLRDLVLHHGQRDKTLDRIIGRGLQEFHGLSQGCSPCPGFRIGVCAAIALELVGAACQCNASRSQLGCATVELGSAVSEVVLGVARCRGQRGG